MKRKWDMDLARTMRREYEAGASVTGLSRSYEMSRKVVRDALAAAGTPMRVQNQVDPEVLGSLLVDRIAGATIRDLATKHGLPRTTVDKVIRRARAALDRRSRSRDSWPPPPPPSG